FLSVPTPALPALFPYTTLFRSDRHDRARTITDVGVVAHRVGIRDGEPSVRSALALSGGDGCDEVSDRVAGGETGSDLIEEAQDRDRKSTRLNSSHVKISYAVFC